MVTPGGGPARRDDRLPAGLVDADAARVGRIADLARAEGWHVRLLDTAAAAGRTSFLDACARQLGLPAWFGHSWDALAECLAGFDARPGLLLVWQGSAALAAGEPAAYATARAVLERAAQAWQAGGRGAVVVAAAAR